MKKHWYLTTLGECPMCGRSKRYRERQYTPRPIDLGERYKFYQEWDYCDSGTY